MCNGPFPQHGHESAHRACTGKAETGSRRGRGVGFRGLGFKAFLGGAGRGGLKPFYVYDLPLGLLSSPLVGVALSAVFRVSEDNRRRSFKMSGREEY